MGPSGVSSNELLRLHKSSGYGTTSFFQYYVNSSDYGLQIGRSDGTKYLVLNNANGNFGVNTTNPIYTLDVTGSGRFTSDLYANAFYYSSDKRLKKDIQTLNNSLKKIEKLRGVSFSWKNSNKAQVGLIAQEVEKVYPELVNTNSKGYKSVEYGNLIAPLIESVKEQQKQLNFQQKEIEKLKKEIEKLNNKK